jgi:hypothetical protein
MDISRLRQGRFHPQRQDQTLCTIFRGAETAKDARPIRVVHVGGVSRELTMGIPAAVLRAAAIARWAAVQAVWTMPPIFAASGRLRLGPTR